MDSRVDRKTENAHQGQAIRADSQFPFQLLLSGTKISPASRLSPITKPFPSGNATFKRFQSQAISRYTLPYLPPYQAVGKYLPGMCFVQYGSSDYMHPLTPDGLEYSFCPPPLVEGL